MKKIGLVLAGVLMTVGFAMFPAVESVLAVKSDLCNDATLDDEQLAAAGCGSQKDAGTVANTVIEVVLGFMGVIAVGVIIYGGFLFLSSSGDAGKVKRGQDAIKYGLIGLVVALLAYAIVAFVSSMVANG